MNARLITVAALVSVGFALDAAAQAKPEVLVKQRQAAMTLFGKYFGPLGGMAQGRVPYNQQVVQRNAAYMEVLKEMPWDGFDESTKGVTETRALPAIWQKNADFKQTAERLRSEVSKLASASKGGDEAAIKKQIGAVGKVCGDCHDSFRRENR